LNQPEVPTLRKTKTEKEQKTTFGGAAKMVFYITDCLSEPVQSAKGHGGSFQSRNPICN